MCMPGRTLSQSLSLSLSVFLFRGHYCTAFWAEIKGEANQDC